MSGQPNKTINPISTSTSTTRRVVSPLDGASAWRELLAEEDLRCERTGFQAGIISIDHGPTESDATQSAEQRSTEADRTAAILAVLSERLEFTHRMCVLNEHEISILLIPVADVGATERMAREINTGLLATGINAAIGFAMRRDDEAGLFGAAGRADACAAVAHSRQLRLTA